MIKRQLCGTTVDSTGPPRADGVHTDRVENGKVELGQKITAGAPVVVITKEALLCTTVISN